MLNRRGIRLIRRASGAFGGAAAGALVVLASLSSASLGESEAQASPPDGGSSFASRAAQGVVSPPDLDDVEQMCLLLTSCENIAIPRQFIPQDFHSCVKKMTEDMTQPSAINFSLTLRECGLGANSCEDLRTCALRGAKPDACKGRGPDSVVGSCEDNGKRALSCWHDRVLAVRDCDRGGESCIVRDGQAMCVLGVCPADIKAGDPSVCGRDGLHVLRCEKGKLASLDCGAFGLKCGALNGSEGAGCVTTLPTCTPGSKRCEGNTAIGCFNGHEVKVDCAAAGHVCGAVPGGVAVGLCTAPPKTECNSGDAATCDGAYVKYCFAGKQRRYFCKPRFNSCVKDNTGVHCR